MQASVGFLVRATTAGVVPRDKNGNGRSGPVYAAFV